MSCGIYKIVAQDGKIYVGKSKNIEKRWRDYKSSFSKLKYQPDLYISFKKYGWFNHSFEILEECDKNEIGCREFYWQHFYEVLGENGLNMLYGSCYDVNLQEQLFNLKNTYFRKSVIAFLYKKEKIGDINFDVRKYLLRRGEKLPRKRGSGIYDRSSEETRIKLKNRSNSQLNKLVLDTQTGVFYNSLKELCTLYNMSYCSMKSKLQEKGKLVNNTQFIYA